MTTPHTPDQTEATDTTTPEPGTSRRRPGTRLVVGVGMLVSLVIAGVLSWFASGSPDGLEHVAETLGFGGSARDSATADSPLADYATSGVDGPLSGGLAGVVGVLVVALVMFGLVSLLRRRR